MAAAVVVRDVGLEAAVVGRVGESDDAVVGVGDLADAVVIVVDSPDAVVVTVSSTPDRTVVVMVDVTVVSPPDVGVTVSGVQIAATIVGMSSVARGRGVAVKHRLHFGGGGCMSSISPEIWELAKDRCVFFAMDLREAEAVCLPILHGCTCYCMRMR